MNDRATQTSELGDRYTDVCPVCGDAVRAVEIVSVEDRSPDVWLICVNDHRVRVRSTA